MAHSSQKIKINNIDLILFLLLKKIGEKLIL